MDGGVQLGLYLSGQHPKGMEPSAALRDHLEQVDLARELGFASVWAPQHFLAHPYCMFQPIPLLARIAAVAEGMTVGTGVLLLTLLNPVECAENAATLDAILAGRFVLGVGLGYRASENAAFGVTGGRGRLLELKLAVVRRLLAGQAVTAHGDGFDLTEARLALVPHRTPPIWIAAHTDRAVRRAALFGDAWLVGPHTRLDELQPQMKMYRSTRATGGLPPAPITPVVKDVCVAPTDEEAVRTARPYLQAKYETYVDWGQSDVLPGADTLRREFSELTHGGRFVLGSPSTCTAILAEHIDRLGANHFLCRLQWPGMPQAHVLQSMRLLAHEVYPALAAHTPAATDC